MRIAADAGILTQNYKNKDDYNGRSAYSNPFRVVRLGWRLGKES